MSTVSIGVNKPTCVCRSCASSAQRITTVASSEATCILQSALTATAYAAIVCAISARYTTRRNLGGATARCAFA